VHCLVYLDWPESSFRATPADLGFLRSLLPPRARITAVRDDAAFLKALPRATHVVTWHFRPEWFDVAPKLKVLATPAAGRELVPKVAPHGVTVHFGGFHGAIISETVLAFVLAWTHGFFHARALPLWPRSLLSAALPRELHGSRAVLLGYGRIGRAIAAHLKAHGVSVFGYSRHLDIPASSLDRELARADWLVAALPSDTGTDDLVNARLLAKLPPRCVFVNVGRGNCVDEKALLAALRANRLAGAYLDVYKNEPITAMRQTNAHAAKRATVDLAALPDASCPWNLVRMPHASSFSPSYVRAAFQELHDDGCL